MFHGIQSFVFPYAGHERRYRLYLPQDFAAGAPLLISLHGGDYAMAYERTHWHELAEEKKFAVLYPESIAEGIAFNSWNLLDEADGRPDDSAFIAALIPHVLAETCCDRQRVYLHGQSMGDMMGTHFLFEHPGLIAAAYLTSGPTKTMWWMDPPGVRRQNPTGPVPVMRLHGEKDIFQAEGYSEEERMLYKQQCHVVKNAECWLAVNGCDGQPQIWTQNEKNMLMYAGKDHCDFWSLFIQDGVHRYPADTERLAWETFLSGYRLIDGHHVYTGAEKELVPDSVNLALALDSQEALVNGQKVPLPSPMYMDNDKLYLDAPAARLLANLMNVNLLIDERVTAAELAEAAGLCHAYRYGAAYATDHAFAMSYDFAYML
ncbi:MAG: hypothetical protein IKF35_06980, partial [Solobacterium sp.]|nr:hypothetical protein [Solobacterium sp.]